MDRVPLLPLPLPLSLPLVLQLLLLRQFTAGVPSDLAAFPTSAPAAASAGETTAAQSWKDTVAAVRVRAAAAATVSAGLSPAVR